MIVGGAGAAIVMVNAFVALCAPAATCTVKGKVPVVVGVPVMAPVLAFSVKPAGEAETQRQATRCRGGCPH